MASALVVAVMAVLLAAYVALPLLFPQHADPLPDERDPLVQELEEERDALFRAIRELEQRDDLAEARREELRGRYEAKAARVLRALDERQRELAGQPAPARPAAARRVPWGVAALLALGAGTAVTLGGWVLPRVGDGTVTTFFQEELSAAEELRELQRVAEREPNRDNLMALADARWRLEDAQGAQEAYRRVIEEIEEAPARAYQRLGLLTLQRDLGEAERLLEQARERDPADPDTLATLGELYLARGAYGEARDAFEALADTPEAAEDPVAEERLELARTLAPLAEAVAEAPSQQNLAALADALWEHDARGPAADLYLQVLREHDANEPTALARLGRLLFEAGRVEEARRVLERARAAADVREVELEAPTLLFLGNAYFTEERWDEAIEAWQAHLERADAPGRVPQLIDQARARRDGLVGPEAEVALPGAAEGGAAAGLDDGGPGAGSAVEAPAEGEGGAALYQAHCASCHGPDGGGGSGPRLAGNRNAGRPANVDDVIRFGRGMMPGFRALLDDDEISLLRDYVVERFGP